jgi:hypothetical protein
MLYLKQSTASQALLLGPFVDDTDGATAETALTIANTDIRLSANGGNMFAKTSGGGTHDEAGWYTITLDATDTATVGRLQISCKVAGALHVFMECQVLEEAIYDALIGASAAGFDSNQRVDVGSWIGTAVTLGSGAPDVNIQSTDDIDLSTTQKASVNTEVDNSMVTYGLDHLISTSVTGTDITDNSIIANLVSSSATADWDDFVNTTESLQAIRDRGDAAWTTGAGGSDRLLMVDTTIATLASQTSFTLTAGSADDDAYNNCTIVIEDVSTTTQKAVGLIFDYTGLTKTVTLKYDPGIFTMAATDKVYILAENALKSTDQNRQLDVTTTGAAGIDWGNVENPTTALDLSGTDIQLCDTVTTLTGHTNQTADHTANIAAILVDTAEIGVAGAGLTNINLPNQTMDIVGNITGNLSGSVGSVTGHTPQTADHTANIAAILVDTNALNDTKIPDTLSLANINAEVDTALDTIIPTSPTAGSINDVLDIQKDAVVEGLAQTGTLSTTVMTTDLTEATDDHYNGRIVVFRGGVLDGQATDITDYSGTNGTITMTAITEAPVNNQAFIIV